jgi:hypothetical protein
MVRGSGKHPELERRASTQVYVRQSNDEDSNCDESRASPMPVENRPTQGNLPDDLQHNGDGQPSSLTTTTDSSTHVRPGTALDRPSSMYKAPQQNESRTEIITLEPPLVTDVNLGSALGTATRDAPILQTVQPYSGPLGPSHPHQTCPQRAVSTSTRGSISGPSNSGRRIPAHPYGLYTQDTSPNDDPVQISTLPSTISVGFPGMTDGYQRGIRPGGEELGVLIGPLGHTEELPPYTRYPDATTYTNKPQDDRPPLTNSSIDEEQLAPPVALASINPTPTPIHPVPGARGIPLATRDPENLSMPDLDSPCSRLSTRRHTSEASHDAINPASPETPEKSFQEKWEERAKKKIWGFIPYWAISLLAVALVLMGVILGAVIGTFLVKHQKGSSREEKSVQLCPHYVLSS